MVFIVFLFFHDAERSLLLTVAWFSLKGMVFMVFHEAERSLLLTVAWFSWSFVVGQQGVQKSFEVAVR